MLFRLWTDAVNISLFHHSVLVIIHLLLSDKRNINIIYSAEVTIRVLSNVHAKNISIAGDMFQLSSCVSEDGFMIY